jgi:hypothetical protein
MGLHSGDSGRSSFARRRFLIRQRSSLLSRNAYPDDLLPRIVSLLIERAPLPDSQALLNSLCGIADNPENADTLFMGIFYPVDSADACGGCTDASVDQSQYATLEETLLARQHVAAAHTADVLSIEVPPSVTVPVVRGVSFFALAGRLGSDARIDRPETRPAACSATAAGDHATRVCRLLQRVRPEQLPCATLRPLLLPQLLGAPYRAVRRCLRRMYGVQVSVPEGDNDMPGSIALDFEHSQ